VIYFTQEKALLTIKTNAMNLQEWIETQDLSVEEFTQQFIEVIKTEYGQHNYKKVLNKVNEGLYTNQHEHDVQGSIDSLYEVFNNAFKI